MTAALQLSDSFYASCENERFLKTKCYGFGEVEQGAVLTDRPSTVQYLALIALASMVSVGSGALLGGVVGGVVSICCLSLKGIILGSTISAGLGLVGTAILVAVIASRIYKPEIEGLKWNKEWSEKQAELKDVGENVFADVAISTDAAEATKWKIDLIKNAKHSVELSGSFCGGKPFIDVMDAIDVALKNNPKLKVRIMISDEIFEDTDQARVDRFKKEHPKADVQFLFTNMKFHFYPRPGRVTPELMTIQNHVKVLVVDEEHVIIGGTNLQENLSTVGLEAPVLPADESFKQRMRSKLWTGAARDQDAMFRSAEMGKTMRWQFYQLWNTWADQMGDQAALKAESYTPLNIVRGEEDEKSIWSKLHAANRIDLDSSVIPLVSHPNAHNSITEAMVKMIDDGAAAKTAIKIAGMSFCPAVPVQEALLRAVNAGRKITIITNGTPADGPFSTRLFAPAHAQYAYPLMVASEDQRKKGLLGRVEVRHWTVPNTMYHKKVVKTETMAFIGNSNLNPKSDGVFVEGNKKVAGDFECGVLLSSPHSLRALDVSFQEDLDDRYSRVISIEEMKGIYDSWLSHFTNNRLSSGT